MTYSDIDGLSRRILKEINQEITDFDQATSLFEKTISENDSLQMDILLYLEQSINFEMDQNSSEIISKVKSCGIIDKIYDEYLQKCGFESDNIIYNPDNINFCTSTIDRFNDICMESEIYDRYYKNQI